MLLGQSDERESYQTGDNTPKKRLMPHVQISTSQVTKRFAASGCPLHLSSGGGGVCMQIKIYRDNRIIMDIKPPYRSSPLTLTNCHQYKARESTGRWPREVWRARHKKKHYWRHLVRAAAEAGELEHRKALYGVRSVCVGSCRRPIVQVVDVYFGHLLISAQVWRVGGDKVV